MPTFGPQPLRYPNASDAPDVPGAILNLIQDMGGVGGAKTYATQAALTASGNGFAGQLAVVTSDSTTALNGVYYSNGSAWSYLTGPAYTGTITYSGIYSGSAATLKTRGAKTGLAGLLVSTSASFTAGTSYSPCTIPASFAPAVNASFMCPGNGTWFQVTITPAGVVGISPGASFTGALSLYLSPCQWETPGV